MLRLCLCGFFCLFLLLQPSGAHAFDQPSSESGYLHARPEALERWRRWRLGLFVHWGPVSLKGTEISWSRAGERRGHRTGRATSGIPIEEYDNLYKRFNPTKFDAEEWVRIARDAGMKYLVFTTKHHDGFVNFDSKLTDYKITSPESPFRRDIVRELADACHRVGFGFGCYYSPPDWHHPDYRVKGRHSRYIAYLHGQIRELCSNYGKVDILWFDGLGGRAEDWDARRLFKEIRALQPDIVLNNRCGLPGDFSTPEQRIGAFDRQRPWETCMTICRQWSWKPGDSLKSLKQIVDALVRVAGGDGNLLLNVGPMPDGRIEPRQVQRLRDLGQWMKQYGCTLYATRGGPYKPGRWGASTCRDNHVFLHVLDWQGSDTLKLPALPEGARILRAQVVSGGTVRLEAPPRELWVTVPRADQQEPDTVVDFTLDRPAFALPALSTARPSGSVARGKPARASNVYHNQVARYGPAKALDDDEETRWATDAGTHQAWLEVDLGKSIPIARVLLCEACGSRVRQFQLQAKDGDRWTTFASGTTLGERTELRFHPVTVRVVRLNILEATEGPTIWEFQLFGPDKPK